MDHTLTRTVYAESTRVNGASTVHTVRTEHTTVTAPTSGDAINALVGPIRKDQTHYE